MRLSDCYYNVAIFIIAIGIFILQMVQAWYILLNACSICTMKIPSTTMKIALSYLYVSYTYIYMYYKHYFLVFSYNAKSSAGFVFFYSIKLSSVHFLSYIFFVIWLIHTLSFEGVDPLDCEKQVRLVNLDWNIAFSYIVKRSAGFLTCWFLFCHKTPHHNKITLHH